MDETTQQQLETLQELHDINRDTRREEQLPEADLPTQEESEARTEADANAPLEALNNPVMPMQVGEIQTALDAVLTGPVLPDATPAPIIYMTSEQLIEKAPRQCPKCGAFVERVMIADDNRLPGYYCNKEGCGWTSPLPGRLMAQFDEYAILGSNLISMIGTAPMNETFRAHIHSKMLKPIPRSCVTFDDIIQWVRTAAPAKYGNQPVPILPHPPRANTPSFEMEVGVDYMEYGSATYSCSRSGSGTYRLSREDIKQFALRSNTFVEFTDRVNRALMSEAQDDPPDSEGEGYNYDNEVATRTDEYSYSISNNILRYELQSFMEEHLPDELDNLL